VAAVAAVPAEAVQVAQGPTLDGRGFIRLADYNGLRMEWEYNQAVLMELCHLTEQLRELYQVNQEAIRANLPHLDGDLHEIMSKMRSDARVVADVVGIRLSESYIAKRSAEYKAKAAESMSDLAARPVLNGRQRTLLQLYDQLSDSTQLTMIDMAEEFANEPTLRRTPQFRVIAGGAA
jgi:hypothetical protein